MDKPVKVRFYTEGKDVLAVFPFIIAKRSRHIHNLCYSHQDRHAYSQREYHYKLKKATKDQYTLLAKELQSIGYDLIILNKD